jgi:uncharacterized protein
MKSSRLWRRLAAGVLLGVAEVAVALVISLALFSDASAQFFDDRFPFWGGHRQRQNQNQNQNQNQWNFFQPFQQQEKPRPEVDYSKAPPPKTPETTSQPLTSVVVMGDSMADWLAYGLETAYTDSPDIGVVRKHRTQSGLVHNEVRADPRGLYPDWPTLAREILNTEKANFVVMMIGLNDRQAIKDRQPPRPVTPPASAPGAQQPASPQTNTQTTQPSPPSQDAESKAPEDYEQTPSPDASPASTEQPQQSKGNGTYEFHTDKWGELYSKRIDETIAALKSKGATVVWVGLPPVRGSKTSSDIAYLNDLFHSRADKAGVIYVDVWDGFVDESGRYTQYGPDVEGQTRRLRTGDGVYFTQAGARKLAHYVEREIERVMTSKTTPIAVPVQIEPTTQEAAPTHPGGALARPLAGPVMPLTAALNAAGPDELAGGSPVHQSLPDAIANRVLVKGDPVPAPQGRADDYAWPRRDVAPTGTDPVASTTTLPMTPMIPERPAQAPTTAASLGPEAAPNAPPQPQHNLSGPKLSGNAWRQREAQRKPSFPFYFLFPGR